MSQNPYKEWFWGNFMWHFSYDNEKCHMSYVTKKCHKQWPKAIPCMGIWHFHMTYDIWHMTYDIWHMTLFFGVTCHIDVTPRMSQKFIPCMGIWHMTYYMWYYSLLFPFYKITFNYNTLLLNFSINFEYVQSWESFPKF